MTHTFKNPGATPRLTRPGASLPIFRPRAVPNDRPRAVPNVRPRAVPIARSGAAALITALCAGFGGGCAVGPNFKTPAAPDTAGYVAGGLPASTVAATGLPAATVAGVPAPPVTAGTAGTAPGGPASGLAAAQTGSGAQRFVQDQDIPGQWWSLFHSTALNAMIDQALKNNPTLEAAQAALREANENVAAQRGSYYPSASLAVEAQRDRASGSAFGIPGFPSSYFYTLDTATVTVSYTLDAFGGIRRQVEGLQAQADYERFALEASYLSLTANIVTSAVSEASLRAQIAATEDVARIQQQELDIVSRRIQAGAASRTDLAQQQATLAATLATLPPLRTQLAQQRNQLATYLGVLPADYQGVEFTLDSLSLPDDLPVSLPSKLVAQRPDVQEYAALLHQATAQIGVATANMLPQITLEGVAGEDASRFSHIFEPSSLVWTLAASVTQPLFEGGKLLHQKRSAVAAARQAAANYKSTVITAFQNVSDTLIALRGDAEALAANDRAVEAASDSLTLLQAQYKSGGASYVQVLTAEQTYQNAVVNQVKARAQRYADTAALFQALGGGWWHRDDAAAAAHDDSISTDCCKVHM